MRSSLLFACAGSLGLGAPAFACSVPASYRVPSNLELTAQADIIAIARVRSGPDVAASSLLLRGMVDRLPNVKFELLHILKGKTDIRRVAEANDAMIIKSSEALSDPDELRLAHPAAYSGTCTRTIFVANAMMVLFLKREAEGDLTIMTPAFARQAEDVPTINARWVRAVREYIGIARQPKDEWLPRLQVREAALRRQSGDRDAIAIADDMKRQIGGGIEGLNGFVDDPIMDRQDSQSRRFDNAVQAALKGVNIPRFDR